MISSVTSLIDEYCSDISDVGLVEAAGKIPVLEELDISYCQFSSKAVAAVGRLCPLLESFKLNARVFKRSYLGSDREAFAIAKNMPGLHHLQIFGNRLMNAGLVAILDGCQHLESLDLRQCLHVNLDADLKRRCSERIKDFRGPNDSTDDYPFAFEVYDGYDGDLISDGEDGEIYGFSSGSDDESHDEEMYYDDL